MYNPSNPTMQLSILETLHLLQLTSGPCESCSYLELATLEVVCLENARFVGRLCLFGESARTNNQ